MDEGRPVITLLAAWFALSPPIQPDPSPNYGDILLPSYVVNGDGTRMQCSPTANYCWPDTSGLPSYLQGR